MERNEEKMTRQSKVFSLIALGVCVVGLTVGFAAFSNTLTISSGATVKPNASDFNVEFGDISGNPFTEETNLTPLGLGESIIVQPGTTTLSGLKANFTEPGDYATYELSIINTGKYDAYLNAINFKNVLNETKNKVCKPDTTTTDETGKTNPASEEFLDDVCEDIKIEINILDDTFETGGYEFISSSVDNDDIEEAWPELVLPKWLGPNDRQHGSFYLTIQIDYNNAGARADGNFTIEFGDIEFLFESVD